MAIRTCLTALALALLAALPLSSQALAKGRLGEFLPKLQAADIDPEASAFGAIEGNPAVAPLTKDGKLVGYGFLNADVVDSTGYSGKPINIVIGLDLTGRITGAKLVEHHEPIVLVGIAESKVVHFIDGYIGRDVLDPKAEFSTPADIVSGATVSMMVIGDSMIRSSIKIAHLHGIGAAVAAAAPTKRQVDRSLGQTQSWQALVADGSVTRLRLTNREINDAFARTGNAEAIARPETGAPDEPFVDLYAAPVSIPTIGKSLLGDAEFATLEKRLKPGQEAILIAGDGPYSFRGSGYVRGGIFDRIEVIQGEGGLRFHDRDYKRIGSLALEDAPDFPEIGLFVTPDGSSLDAAEPWRLQLLVQRRTGAMDKAFITVEASYTTPEKYLLPAPTPAPTAAAVPALPATAVTTSEEEPGPPLWQRIWQGRLIDVAILLAAIGVLTAIFFFQDILVKRPVLYERIRVGYLGFTLLWIGWYEHAQLSVVNVFTFANALRGSFRWDYFLMDPLVFILWCSVAVSLLFWSRGAFCGWLCPFGALQELSNKLAKLAHVPQLRLPFGLHQRLWPVKYIIFLGLFGVSLGSLATAEKLAEIEPFKTAIILHFMRDWWFVLLAIVLLAPGLFIERFYCRYMCPLGGALAIPARMRMFDWLRRYRECGSPCQRCGNECPVQAIHPEGHINPNECIQCLNCQVLYHHDQKCPVMIQRRIKREKRMAMAAPPPAGKTLETVSDN